MQRSKRFLLELLAMKLHVLVALNEMFAKALNRNLNLQRYKVLYICGNYCSILSSLDHKFQDLETRLPSQSFSS